MEETKKLVQALRDKDHNYGWACFKKLQEKSLSSAAVYQYFDEFAAMLEDKNSYVKNRALLLIAANARWDKKGKTDQIIEIYLNLLADEKPVTVRQCIQALPEIIKHRPHLKKLVLSALKKIKLQEYKESMQPLLAKDLENALALIEGGST